MKRLSIFATATLIAVSSFAQLSIWNGSSDLWTKGAGTQASPYQIESAEQLAFIAEMVNAGVTTYENTYFKLMTNIDLNNLTWVPIGSSETNCFKGHFDGNNKTIFGVSKPLFSYIEDAYLTRINIEMQCLVENAISSQISYINAHAIYKTRTWKKLAGIVLTGQSCVISNCRSTITMGANNTASEFAGGIIATGTNCEITNCRTNGCIRGSNGNYGGIAGNLNNGYFYSCANNCNVQATTNYIGCIVGSGIGNITYCCSLDSLKKGAYYYGTLVGYAIYNESTHQYDIWNISNSFTVGYNVEGDYWPSANFSNVHLDKTEAAMKSVSFPIILNADSTVFIKDNYDVNDGYPIYKTQVYSVTKAADNIGFTSAHLNGNFYAENVDSVGFEYKEKNDSQHWYNSAAVTTLNTPVSHSISNLTAGTEYIYRIWVEKEGVRHFGDTISLTTMACSDEVTPIAATICNGEEYIWNNLVLTQSGPYRDTLTSINGCDSIVELTLSVLPTNNIDKYDTIAVGDSYDFYGEILSETGIYYHYVPAGEYCNLLILHLQVGKSDQPSTALENTNDENIIPNKLFKDGQVLIKRNNKTYSVTGTEVR